MSHIFKLMKENVSDAPLEASRDADAIGEEMDVRVFVCVPLVPVLSLYQLQAAIPTSVCL